MKTRKALTKVLVGAALAVMAAVAGVGFPVRAAHAAAPDGETHGAGLASPIAGITQGQTARLSVWNAGNRNIQVQFLFIDGDGKALFIYDGVVPAGKSLSDDYKHPGGANRIELHSEVRVGDVLDLEGLVPSLQIIEDKTGKTVEMYGGNDFMRFTPKLSPTEPADGKFVQQVYQDLLARPATPSEEDFWAGQIPTLGREGVVNSIVHSREYFVKLVQGYFTQFLRRDAATDEVSFYVERLLAGTTDAQVIAILLGSTEYYVRSGGGTDAGFVSTIFRDLLGRAPSSREVDFWAGRISAVGRAGVVSEITSSTEYLMLLVRDYYTRFLRRTGTDDEIAMWVRALQRGMTNEQVIAALLGSPEYYALATV